MSTHETDEKTDRTPKIPNEWHVCDYGTTGRCPCGFHRNPARGGITLETTAKAARERLAVEI
jgi:hypothetical protein